jgi:hypothetical protein
MEMIDGGQVKTNCRGWIGDNVIFGITCEQSPVRQLGHGPPAGVDKIMVTHFADETIERAVVTRLLGC